MGSEIFLTLDPGWKNWILNTSVADPKQKFRILFRIRIRLEVSFGFGSGFGSGSESWIRV
jgi:hypothetical protein